MGTEGRAVPGRYYRHCELIASSPPWLCHAVADHSTLRFWLDEAHVRDSAQIHVGLCRLLGSVSLSVALFRQPSLTLTAACFTSLPRYGRDSKSIDINQKVCGRCRGRLVAQFPDTPARPPTAYQGERLCCTFSREMKLGPLTLLFLLNDSLCSKELRGRQAGDGRREPGRDHAANG